MSSPFVAEIRICAFNFPQTGWAFCDGQLLPISQNTALFSLLGTYYGGDGKSTFALPDLQGSAAVSTGQGNGLSERFLGEMSGTPTVTLLTSEIALHNHTMSVSSARTDEEGTKDPTNNTLGRGPTPAKTYAAFPGTPVAMAPNALGITGGSLPHNNMMPSLVLNFCIAMQGIFPARP